MWDVQNNFELGGIMFFFSRIQTQQINITFILVNISKLY